eukprot:Gb_22900 [translate_table: standard]
MPFFSVGALPPVGSPPREAIDERGGAGIPRRLSFPRQVRGGPSAGGRASGEGGPLAGEGEGRRRQWGEVAAAAAATTALVIRGTFVVRSWLQNRRKNTDISKMFKGSPRLPTFGIPRLYDLHLRPDLNACKFDGKLAITLDVVQDIKYLVLNAADLAIVNDSVRLRSTNSQQVLFPSSVSIDAKDEILVLEFEETLPRGEAILEIEFQGTLNDHMRGFYRSTYVINGKKKNMAVTQFEPADARRCFPCWDEPSYKDPSSISIAQNTSRGMRRLSAINCSSHMTVA